MTVGETAKELRPSLYMVYWSEPFGNRVTHIQDFENDGVFANLVLREGQFTNLKGPWARLE